MYEYISGKLTVKNLEYACIDINGLGYKMSIPFKTYEKLPNIGENVKLYIHMNVKEDDISLYGFFTEHERTIFKLTISVSGIGPKIALSILSSFTPSEISGIINSEQSQLLSKVPGLGIKKAQKLIIELKGKVNIESNDVANFDIFVIKNDIKLALSSLGYDKIKINDYISDEEILEVKDSGKLMKEILKKLANK